jgi:quercetin 2,3-dioxygenase
MDKILYPSSTRGFLNHGWLKTAHSFSFANYYNEDRINFGKLRVLNDDAIAPKMGFDLHPHQDMEIITIPLSGSLRHVDNMGNEGIISTGEVQVMSAGTGIWHSEYNASDKEELTLFQVWIFTDKKGHKPRYGQKLFLPEGRQDKWQLLVSPDGRGESLWIHQNAFISIIESGGSNSKYLLNDPLNAAYFTVIEGEAAIAGEKLSKRDAVGLWNAGANIEVQFSRQTKLLSIEVPA